MISSNIEFDFDDILIVPAVSSDIISRYKNIELPQRMPLFTAPMDTVVNLKNAELFLKNGINVALPRTITHNDFINKIKHYESSSMFISMGFETLNVLLKNGLKELHLNANILIDTANGHMEKIADYCRDIKYLRPDIVIMVGNIANPETYTWYAKQNCVNLIRVGIGNGGGCLTTKQSGVGHPMASLIHEVYLAKQKFIESNNIDIKYQYSLVHTKPVDVVPAIVADGGMKDYADIIKALALGADFVMIGSIFNKTLESSADNYLYKIKLNKKLANYFFNKGYPVKKYFRGMSTKEAQKAMGKTQIKTSEGVIRYRKVECHLDGWVENFQHYLRNAMSYTNAKTLDEFIGKVNICQISKNAYDRFNK
jgi:IMP dehydrogenase/GMP reductase